MTDQEFEEAVQAKQNAEAALTHAECVLWQAQADLEAAQRALGGIPPVDPGAGLDLAPAAILE